MDYYALLAEIGIIAFFLFLYYVYQKRRINYYHHDDKTEAYALWIYDYHHYLDSIKNSPDYQTLNTFVVDIEKVDLSNATERALLLEKIPEAMEAVLKSRLKEILTK